MSKISNSVGDLHLVSLFLILSCALPLVSCADSNSQSISEQVGLYKLQAREQVIESNRVVKVYSDESRKTKDEVDSDSVTTFYQQNAGVQQEHSVTIISHGSKIRIRGNIEFSADDSAITAMSDGALFEFEYTDKKGMVHEVSIHKLLGQDDMSVNYLRDSQTVVGVDNNVVLTKLLPKVLKESALVAKSRIALKLQVFGYERLCDYIASVQSDAAKSIYIQHLLNIHSLTAKQWDYWLQVASRFEQQHEQAVILQALASQMNILGFGLQSDEFALLRNKVARLNQHYRFEVYSSYLLEFDYQYRDFAQLLELLDNNHYRFELLVKLIDKEKSLQEQDIHDLVRLVQSDHYKAEIYAGVIDKPWFNAQSLTEVMLAISSDHYRYEMFRKFMYVNGAGLFDLEDLKVHELAIEDIGIALSYIESDHYKTQLFFYLLTDDRYKSQAISFILKHFSNIGSEHYQEQLLSIMLSHDLLTNEHISALKDHIFRLNSVQAKQMLNRRMTKLEKS